MILDLCLILVLRHMDAEANILKGKKVEKYFKLVAIPATIKDGVYQDLSRTR